MRRVQAGVMSALSSFIAAIRPSSSRLSVCLLTDGMKRWRRREENKRGKETKEIDSIGAQESSVVVLNLPRGLAEPPLELHLKYALHS